MIFSFLRQYLHDEEFEQTKLQLQESQYLLEEYKEFIQAEKNKPSDDKEKVDADFLGLIWASIALSIAIFTESAKKSVELQAVQNLEFYVWTVFAVSAIIFTYRVSIFGLYLTRKYAEAKSDRRYSDYAYNLIFGAVVFVVGVIILVVFK